MASGAVDLQVEVGEPGHERPALGGEPSSLVGFDVDSVRSDKGHACRLEEALGDHRLGASFDFLGRLEHEHDGPGQLVTVRGEQTSGTDEASSVHVMATSVHVAVRRGVVESGVLSDGQGIHVPPQQHRRSGTSALEHGDDRGQRLSGGDFEAQVGEFFEDGLLGEGQLVAELWVGVQGATQCHKIVLQILSLGAEIGDS